eukprot:TRINITY_DN78446_c0_g1_i1.p1 TRINITY_DN78446_c0_g1~~TRINITY_DN78446_c0_g1_i1.p1  ORF type:complete len:273 (+),score=76.71 TRINITY_DN78446_c0_g1_i1:48-821(+)
MAPSFATACCRCMWPFGIRCGRALFPDPKKDEDRDEEEQHLLGNVIDSDEEQADALSPDQIRRFLDESKASRSSSSASSSRQPRSHVSSAPGTAGIAAGGTGLVGKTLSEQHGSSGRLVNEHDELFDEEFDDEPESLVVGAVFRPPGGVPSGEGSFTPEETGGAGLGFGGIASKQRAAAAGAAAAGSPPQGFFIGDDDDDDDEVTGPSVVLAASSSYGPGGRLGAGEDACMVTSQQALGVLPSAESLMKSVDDGLQC